MLDSDTSKSSDTKINYKDNYGENLLDIKKGQTTDTDFYFKMLANPNKIVEKVKSISESSEMSKSLSSDTDSDKSSTKSSSKQKFESIPIPQIKPTIPTIPTRDKFVPLHTNNNTETNNIQYTETIQKQPTVQETRIKKIEMLRKLSELKINGFSLSKEYDFNSSLDEMEYEFELLKSFVDKRNGVKMFKSGLVQCVSIIEFLNDKYDPFDFYLAGWTDNISIEMESWENVLEELYEKYRGGGRSMPPEIKLLFLLVASAGAFHFRKSNEANMPSLNGFLSANPNLLNSVLNPNTQKFSQFKTAQEINIEKQKEELKKKETLASQEKIKELEKKNQELQNKLVQKQDKNFNNGPLAQNDFRNMNPTIKTPPNVQDILNKLHTNINNNKDDDDSNHINDRLVSETTVTETNSSIKKRGPKGKKPTIKII